MDPEEKPLIIKKPSPFQVFMSGPMTRNKAIILGVILAVALFITGASFWLGFRSQNQEGEVPTPTPTVEVSPTLEPTPSEEPSPTDSPTPTKKPSPTPTKTPTPTATSTPTSTPTSTATPTPTTAAFMVTAVTVNYVGYTGTCSPGKTHTFSGDITTSGAGIVRYRWTRSEQPTEGVAKTLTFSGSGTLHVEQDEWTLSSSSFSGWDRIDILEPNSTSSNQKDFTHTCP
jgi:hypothetical protein